MNHLYKLFLSLIYVREEASFDTLELKANSRNVQKGSILGPLIFNIFLGGLFLLSSDTYSQLC